MDMSGKIKEITSKLGVSFIYKTSFDKANEFLNGKLLLKSLIHLDDEDIAQLIFSDEPMPMCFDQVVFRAITENFHSWPNIHEPNLIAISVARCAIGNQIFYRPLIIDRQAEQLNTITWCQ